MEQRYYKIKGLPHHCNYLDIFYSFSCPGNVRHIVLLAKIENCPWPWEVAFDISANGDYLWAWVHPVLGCALV
jgi:hypothetical protein